VTAPNPQCRASYLEHEGPDDQRLYCAHRDHCLDVAAERHWPALTCVHCVAYQPMGVAQIQADTTPLVAVLCELVRPPSAIGYRRRRP
jgi:hypothetical protein